MARQATDYGDPYFRARWGKRGSGLELVQHRGQCMCGRFCFRLLAPADVKALDCPGRIRYPHIFVPAGAFTPLSDLRLLTLYSARSPVLAHVVVHAFCSACGVPVFRASGASSFFLGGDQEADAPLRLFCCLALFSFSNPTSKQTGRSTRWW